VKSAENISLNQR